MNLTDEQLTGYLVDRYFVTSYPERLGMKLLTFSGSIRSPEECFTRMTGQGIGLDLIKCSDYSQLGKYFIGLKWMNVTITSWKSDLGVDIHRWELEEEFPEWFLEKFLGSEYECSILRCRNRELVQQRRT